jgi:O-antigen/teichoic acid export membrane protein
MFNRLRSQQGAGAGSVHIVASFFVAGVLTYAFQSIYLHALGKAGSAPLALLWSATFLTVQVLWIGGTQTLGRYIAERETHESDWGPVVSSVRRWQFGVAAVFVVAVLIASPVLTEQLFGSAWLTAAFILAVVCYAPEYFRRGIFNGHRQSLRLGAQIVAESAARLILAAGLLAVGWGVFGAALAIVIAPVVGVLAVRPAPVAPPKGEGDAFSTGKALRFAGPVLLCMAFAQALMNGGPILASLLDGTDAQIGLFSAALTLTRIPQYVFSPAVGALLPRASRVLSSEGPLAFDRFVFRALAAVGLVGVLMVGGTWLLGDWALEIYAGHEFETGLSVLVALAAMAAFYLLSETVSQSLFALGRGKLAAIGWFIGLLASAACLAWLGVGVVERVSYSLAAGTFTAAVAQAAFYLALRRRGV